MQLLRGNQPLRRALTTNSTDNGFTSLVPTTTQPSAAGVFFPGGKPATTYALGTINESSSLETPYSMMAVFFGTGAENATFSARLTGWKQTEGVNATSLWIPIPLLQVTCTLSTAVGVASAEVINTERFVDTLSLSAPYGTTDQNGVLVTSTTGDLIAHLVASLHGFGAYQWTFTTGGSATDCNALFTYW